MITQADVTRVVARIVAGYDPERIVLFGSFAKGTHSETSDIDLLIIKRTPLPRHRRGRDLRALLADIATEVDLLFYTPDEVELELADPHSFLSNVMVHARTLHPPQPDTSACR